MFNKNDINIGQIVILGSYPQTASGTDNTPIEWIVLDDDGESTLLISKYALDAKQYNNDPTIINWEVCSLRAWLNNDFYNRAFSDLDKQYIISSVSININQTVMDNVYLLSADEVEQYFKNDSDCMCAPTDYAVKNGAWTLDTYKMDHRACGWWWLRSPGYYGSRAASVLNVGFIGDIGDYVDGSNCVVRPVVRVDSKYLQQIIHN